MCRKFEKRRKFDGMIKLENNDLDIFIRMIDFSLSTSANKYWKVRNRRYFEKNPVEKSEKQ